MLKGAAVLQHDFSKMEPDMHHYDVIRLQIFHALHAVFSRTFWQIFRSVQSPKDAV